MHIVRAGQSNSIIYKNKRFITKRIESIDLLRGTAIIIMTLDQVRVFFHRDSFLFSPTDLSQTNIPVFFTSWAAGFCAPVFVFLAGISAYLYGIKHGTKELSVYLLTRGLWLTLAALLIVTLEQTFDPTYAVINLQLLWTIGISMMVLSAMIYVKPVYILLAGLLLTGGHNLLDAVHVTGTGITAMLWNVLHDAGQYTVGRFTIIIDYPVLPWIGILATGYYFGTMYVPGYHREKREGALFLLGIGAIAVFIVLRSYNWYGEPAQWAIQENPFFGVLSFLNVTRRPPSLQCILMTLGPALVFLGLAEKPLNKLTATISVLGRTPLFYYFLHIFFIHLLAVAVFDVRDTLCTGDKAYGVNLLTVYIVWGIVVLLLYPLCKWFDKYKSNHREKKWWLRYL